MFRPASLAGATTLLVCAGAAAQPAPTQSADITIAYPAEVALSEDGDRGFVFRRFPGSQRLYTYDLDLGGRSACNVGCMEARPPVLAPPAATPVGDWTLVRRDDGANQWAYKGKPVYTLFHDAPSAPAGVGQGWRLLPHMASTQPVKP